MVNSLAAARLNDPLFRVPLEHTSELSVFGVPVRLESNHADVLAIAEEAFGLRADAAPRGAHSDAPPLAVRVVVHQGGEGSGERAPIIARVPDADRLVLSAPGGVGVADVRRRDAVAYVTPELVADREHFRHGIVEALTLFLVTHFDRQPVHAAAVSRGDRAVLLAGASGVGKSSLAYAAMDAGLRVLADDAVYVQRSPRLRVWGLPRFVHLPPSACAHFPELRDTWPAVQSTGKLKIAVDLRISGGMQVPPVAERVGVCVLARSVGDSRLEALPASEAASILARQVETGFDLFAGTLEACVAELARSGSWRLTMGSPPRSLVAHLITILDDLG